MSFKNGEEVYLLSEVVQDLDMQENRRPLLYVSPLGPTMCYIRVPNEGIRIFDTKDLTDGKSIKSWEEAIDEIWDRCDGSFATEEAEELGSAVLQILESCMKELSNEG